MHVGVGESGEGIGENGDLEQSEVVAPIEDFVFQSEVIDGIVPRFVLVSVWIIYLIHFDSDRWW